MKSAIVPALLFILFCGCMHNKPITFDSNKNYKAIAEGYYNFPAQWMGKCPAVILKKKDRIHLGEFVCLTDSNVSIVKSREGSLGKANTVYFPLDEVQTVINSSGSCIYGEIPQKIIDRNNIIVGIYLTNEKGETLNRWETANQYIEMFPNQPFACVVEPGKYSITKIEFRSNEETLQSLYVPQISVTIEKNKTNYLGNITLVFNNKEIDNWIKIPYTLQSGHFSDKSDNDYYTYKENFCFLKVEYDSTFSFQSKLPVVNNLLHGVASEDDIIE